MNPTRPVKFSPFVLIITHAIKTILFLGIVAEMAVGCGPSERGPVMKRMANDVQFDQHYLTDVFIPSIEDQNTRMALTNSINQLGEHLTEFRTFMNQVEVGKIAVTKSMTGEWQSFQQNNNYWICAGYFERSGTVRQFEKCINKNPSPLVYEFQFYKNGYLHLATTINHGFEFDEQGRVRTFWSKSTTGQQEWRVGDDGKIHKWTFGK